jgi:hypothetical protein
MNVIALVCFVLAVLAAFKWNSRLEAEDAVRRASADRQ